MGYLITFWFVAVLIGVLFLLNKDMDDWSASYGSGRTPRTRYAWAALALYLSFIPFVMIVLSLE